MAIVYKYTSPSGKSYIGQTSTNRQNREGKEAEKITGISHSNIVAVCNGRRKTAGGFIWKYELDVLRLIPME